MNAVLSLTSPLCSVRDAHTPGAKHIQVWVLLLQLKPSGNTFIDTLRYVILKPGKLKILTNTNNVWRFDYYK